MKQRLSFFLPIIFLLLLFVCCFFSIFYGVKSTNLTIITDIITQKNTNSFYYDVVLARIPRTIFGILAGAALGIAGTLMQIITKNPIADPSILGVNSGASFFVLCGISFLHIQNKNHFIWFAFLGGLCAAIFVFFIAGSSKMTPVKLALSGAATSTFLYSMTNIILFLNLQTMEMFRFWQIGSIGGASFSDIKTMLPYLLLGFLISFLLLPYIHILMLGDEHAVTLGVPVVFIRTSIILASVLLCSATTALAGPIGFIGLIVPHIVKKFCGANIYKLLPLSGILGACVLLFADTLGRILGRPSEMETGIITALIGGPIFILTICKQKGREQ